MTPQMPAVCSASGKHRGLTHYKHGVVAWKSDHSKGKTLCQAFLFLHRQLCGKESPHRVPKTSHGGFVRHKADCHGAVLVPHRSAREEVFPVGVWDTSLRGCLGHVPQTQQGTGLSPPLKAPLGPQLSPPGLGLGFPGSRRIKIAFSPTFEL